MNKNFKKHVKDTEKRFLIRFIFLILVFIGIVLVYIFSGYFPFKSGSIITIGVVLGGVIGAFLLKLVKQKVIKYTFIFLMLISGIKLVLV